MRVRYGELDSQWAELSVPDGPGPHRVCVLVHGGFWSDEYDLALMRQLARDLVMRGWAAYNIEFRRLGGGGEWPNMFTDVATAVDALGGPAAGDGGADLDLDRVAVTGHSSGGHLAAWAAGRPRLPAGAVGAGPKVTVRAAVLQAAVLDLAALATRSLAATERDGSLTGVDMPVDAESGYASSPCQHEEIARQRLRVTSPLELAPLGVPTLAVHGLDDTMVDVSQSERFAAHDPGCELELFAGEDHLGHLSATNPMWEAAAAWLEARLPAGAGRPG